MANRRGPKIVTNGLVFAVDPANPKSYDNGSAPLDVINTINTTNTSQITGSFKNGVIYTDGTWDFDGTDDHIDFFPQKDYGLVNTISCWLNADAFNGIPIGGGDRNSFLLYLVNSTQISTRPNAFIPAKTDFTTPTLNLGQWYHIVITRNGTAVELYLDGGLVDTGTLGLNSVSLFRFIGKEESGDNGFSFNGRISNVKVYTKILSASEILQNYNATKRRYQ